MRRTAFRVSEGLDPESEAAFYWKLTAREHAELLAAACRGAAALLRARPDPERATDFVDPLPASTVKALARLREEARERDRSRSGAG